MSKSMWALDAPKRIALLVWALGILVSLGLGWSTSSDNRQAADRRLAEAATSVAQHVRERLTLYENGLRGTRGAVMAAGADDVTRSEFEAYVASRDMRSEFPGARGFGFIRRVPRAAESGFLATARAEGPAGFSIRELAPHDGDRFVIQYIYPLADNTGATGLDIASEPNRREAAVSAMDSGEPRLTAPITLVQASGRSGSGFLMLLPVYRSGLVPVETPVRRAETVGWAYAPLVAEEMLVDLGPMADEVLVKLSDVATGQPFLQRGAPPGATEVDLPAQRLEFTVAGRQWVLEVRALTPLLEAVQVSSPSARLLQGGVVSSLLAALIWLVLRQRQQRATAVPGGLDLQPARSETGRLGLAGFFSQRLTQVALLGYAVAVVLLVMFDQSSRFNAGQRQARTQLESIVKTQVEGVSARRAFRRKSLVFLASTSEVEAIARTSRTGAASASGDDLRALERLFSAYLKANPELQSLRLTGLRQGARELFRVERRGEAVAVVPPQELRAEPDSTEVVQAARLGQGEVFVSDVTLLREHGEVRRPLRPMVQFSTPVLDAAGLPVAVLVMAVNSMSFLPDAQLPDNAQLDEDLGGAVMSMLVNSQGDYLEHPDATRRYAHEFGPAPRWTDDYQVEVLDGQTGKTRWNSPTGPVVLAMQVLQSNPDTDIGSLRYIATLSLARLQALAWREAMGRMPLYVAFGVVGGCMLYLYWIGVRRRLDARSQRLRLADLVDQTSDAIIGMDVQGRVTSWNRGARELFGYPAELAVGRLLEALIAPDGQIGNGYLPLEGLGEPSGSRVLELLCRTRSGQALQVSMSLSVLRELDGTVAGLSAMVRDITAERQAQQALAELNANLEETVRERTASLMDERRMLRDVLRGTNAGTWAWNVQTGETRFNERWADIVGYRLEELEPVSIETWQRLTHPDDLKQSGAALQRHFAGEAPDYEIEVRMRHKDGHWVWVLDRGRVTSWTADGQPEWMHGTHQDVTRTREAQMRLAESESLLRRTGRVAGVGGWQYDPADGLVVWTRQTREIHEVDDSYPPDPEKLLAFYPEGEARDRIRAAIARAMREAEPFDLELPFITARGRQIRVRAVGEPVLDDNGRPVRIVGALQDITARYLMEAELRRVNELQQSILDNLPCGLSAFDAQLSLVACNKEFVTLLGLEPLFENGVPTFEDIIRFNAERGEYGNVDLEEAVEQILARARAPVPHRFERTRPDGTPIEVRGTPMPGGGFVTTYTDLADRKQAERRSERNEALLRGAIAAIDEAFVLFDAQERLVLCNDKFRALYDTVADLIVPGTRFEDILRVGVGREQFPEAKADPKGWISSRLADFRAGEHTSVYRLDNGRVVRVIDRRMPDGHTVGFRLDITDLVRATEAAQEASRAKGEFLANMSHEIRTPLHAVIGLTHLLADTPLTVRQQQLVGKSQMASQSLLAIVNNVLDLAKIEAGEMPLEAEPFRVRELINEMEAVFVQQADAKGVGLHFEVDRSLPAVLLGDVLRLRQVMTNLVGNALKFTEQGSVTARLERLPSPQGADRDQVMLGVRVIDTGVGIPAEVQERLFSPFSQADASTTRRFGGTGLGLSIVRRLVELMGGAVGLESTPGTGSEFRFELPLRQVSDTDDRGTLELLVVDDVPAERKALVDMARAFGWRTETCESGEALVDWMARRQAQGLPMPDAMLVDWMLPGIDGLTALQQVTDQMGARNLPATLMVSSSDRDRVAGLDTGRLADAILTKPVNASVLFNAVNHSVVRRQGNSTRVVPAPMLAGSTQLQSLPGVRLLLVDDSDINLEIGTHLLSREGASVTTASNGREALAILRQDPSEFDAVLMDVQMPEMDGLEATRAMRRESELSALPVIALTAGALAQERRRAMEAGMNEFLTKPLEPATMVRTVRQAIERATGLQVPVLNLEGAAPTRAPTQAWPEIDGIDGPKAAARLGNDVSLLRLSLSRLSDGFGDIVVQPWPAPASEPDRSALAARLHKLRGAASMIDAVEVSRAADAVECGLRDGVPQAALADPWRTLQQALSRLLGSAGVWLGQQQGQKAPARAVPPASDLTLSRLVGLLSTNDMDALALFETEADGLRARLGDAAMDQVGRLMDTLDFAAAARLLQGESAA
ncbi:MAG: hypothetical protein C0451_07120 [Comamonadaceae bacterium]|nr:hypothetical protein [Comamonadaceae bacterium]